MMTREETAAWLNLPEPLLTCPALPRGERLALYGHRYTTQKLWGRLIRRMFMDEYLAWLQHDSAAIEQIVRRRAAPVRRLRARNYALKNALHAALNGEVP